MIGQEVSIAVSRSKEAVFGTLPLIDAEYTQFGFTERDPAIPDFQTEDDANETGAGHEFPTTNYKVSKGITKTLAAVCSSEIMAFIAAFGMGKVVKTGIGPFVYTATFADRAVDGEDMPTFGLVQELRAWEPGWAGNAISGWGLSLQRGASRSAATVSINVVGIGKETNPSTITMPARLSQNDLLSASLLLTAVGNDYVTPATINSLELTVELGLDVEDMFFPGSGTEDGFALGGRTRYGVRSVSLNVNAEFTGETLEIDKIKAQTEGVVTIQLINDPAVEDALITLPRSVFGGLSFTEGPQNRVEIVGDIRMLQPVAADIFELVATTNLDGFGVVAA